MKQWFYLTGKAMTDFIFFHIQFSFSIIHTQCFDNQSPNLCPPYQNTLIRKLLPTLRGALPQPLHPPGPQSSECQRRPLELGGSSMVFRLTTPLSSCSDPSRDRSSLPPGPKVPAQKPCLSAFSPMLHCGEEA